MKRLSIIRCLLLLLLSVGRAWAGPGKAPAGVTRDATEVVAAPMRLHIDFGENLLLGDSGGGTLATVRRQGRSLEGCLAKLHGRALLKPPRSIDLKVDAKGKLSRVSLSGSGTEAATACMKRILERVRFPDGGEVFGIVKLKSGAPPKLQRDPSVDMITWKTRSGGFGITMQAKRVRAGPRAWTVELSADMRALGKPRGVGHSLRYNMVLHRKGGGSSNAFSLQDATTVETCLRPGQHKRVVRTVSERIVRGERLDLSVNLLGGACNDGKGRWEVGMVYLSWTSGDRPTLYVAPPWYEEPEPYPRRH